MTTPEGIAVTPDEPLDAAVQHETAEQTPADGEEASVGGEISPEDVARTFTERLLVHDGPNTRALLRAVMPRSIPPDIDRQLLYQARYALRTDVVGDEFRKRMREVFWEIVDGDAPAG